MTASLRVVSPRRPLRALFLVQGEGRGHTTQALALAEMLRAAGHVVVGALVGTSARRPVPALFADALGAPTGTYHSPNFASDRDGRIALAATGLRALRTAPQAWAGLDRIAAAVDRTEPDVVISFYEGLAGAFSLARGFDVPHVAVGHQFMMSHPAYPLAPGQPVQRLALEAYTRLAAAGAAVRLGLSFYDAPGAAGLRVVPPLLRRRLFSLDGLGDDGSLLVYLMEPAMARGLVAWSDRHPDVRVDCFSDAPPHAHSPALEFHALSGTRFLERMARCRGVVCTAGFESVSEAMWLGKPVLMLPVPNHYEQRCNAADAAALGAGLDGRGLEMSAALDAFADCLEAPRPASGSFRAWVAEAPRRAVGAVEGAAGWVPLPAAAPPEAPAARAA